MMASKDERRQAEEEVRRYADEFGVSLAEAWAERGKWEAEHAINHYTRLIADGEAEERRLTAALRATRAELRQRRRHLAAAHAKRDKAEADAHRVRTHAS